MTIDIPTLPKSHIKQLHENNQNMYFIYTI
jgi:hypothetical protein